MAKLSSITKSPMQAWYVDWKVKKEKKDFDHIESLATAIMKSAQKGKRSVNRIGTHAEKDYLREKTANLNETVKELVD